MVQVKEIHALVGHEHCRAASHSPLLSALKLYMIVIPAGLQGCLTSSLARRGLIFDGGVSVGPAASTKLLQASSAGAEHL